MNLKKNDKWQTPPHIFEELNERFNFDHDPCPIDWEEGDVDGLQSKWKKRNFVNPPYSQTSLWVKKSFEEYKKGNLVVLLINVITDTLVFKDYIAPYAEVEFIFGRLYFLDENGKKSNSCPKPSMLCIFDPNKKLKSRVKTFVPISKQNNKRLKTYCIFLFLILCLL